MKSSLLDLRTYFLFLILSVSTSLIFTRYALISFFVFIIILAVTISKNSRSWPGQTVWVYLAFFCLLTIISATGWIVGLEITPTMLLLILALLAWLVVLRLPKKINEKQPQQKNDYGWLGVAVALLVCFYVSIPTLLNFSSESVLQYAAKTGDDINHIGRIEAIRNAGGLLYQQRTVAGQVIDPGTAASPQGWHYNGAFMESLIIRLSGSDIIDTRLLSYLLYKTLWLFITVYLLYALLMMISGIFLRIGGILFNFQAAISIAVVSVLFLVSVFGYGFQNFIASIALVCASLIIALKYITNTDLSRKRIYIFGLVALTATTFYVWTLMGAVVGLIALYALAREFLTKYKMSWSWKQLFIASILGPLVALPIYMLLRSGSERGIETINSGGAAPPISIIGVFSFFLLTVLVVKNLRLKKGNWLLLLLFLVTLEFIILSIYQQLTVSEQRYYAIKLAYLVSIITSVVFLAVIPRLLSFFSYSRYLMAVFYIAILAILPILLGLDIRKSAYPLKNSTPIKIMTARKILDLPPGSDGPETIINTSDKEESFLATKLWSTIHLDTSAERKVLLEKMNKEIKNQP